MQINTIPNPNRPTKYFLTMAFIPNFTSLKLPEQPFAFPNPETFYFQKVKQVGQREEFSPFDCQECDTADNASTRQTAPRYHQSSRVY